MQSSEFFKQVLCTAATILFAGNPYIVQIIPKGDCTWCCPLDPKNDVTLHLYTKVNDMIEYDIYQRSKDSYYLMNNKPIVIYIHGFTESALGPNSQEIKKAYMQRGEENLILVDWSRLAALPWYNHAIANTYYVAVAVSSFIDGLVSQGHVPIERFHVVGFSLGAEIAGLIGKMVKTGKLRRITGLDPAMPLYLGSGPTGRLDKNDADFVDVIHTDGGVLGFDQTLGHADFFPNGGKPAQPGCTIESLSKTGRIDDYVACSHNRAWKYFSESVEFPCHFPVVQCDSLEHYNEGKCHKSNYPAFMGYEANPNLRGKFFLETNQDAPYGKGMKGLEHSHENDKLLITHA